MNRATNIMPTSTFIYRPKLTCEALEIPRPNKVKRINHTMADPK